MPLLTRSQEHRLDWFANMVLQGTYNVVADVFTEKGERITCLTATVTFSMNGLGDIDDNEL